MAILDALTIGARISFDLYPSAVIGTTFNNAEVLAILDVDTATLFEDVLAVHANVYNTLPPGTLNDPRSYLYVKLRLENAKIIIIGLPWIKEDSITVNTTTNMQVTVVAVNPADQIRFREICAANGFTVVVTAIG